jgi:hypothetical protein
VAISLYSIAITMSVTRVERGCFDVAAVASGPRAGGRWMEIIGSLTTMQDQQLCPTNVVPGLHSRALEWTRKRWKPNEHKG